MIKAKIDTLLKSHPVDSSSQSLPDRFSAHQVKKGQEIDYNWRGEESNHYLLELKAPIQGRFNWYAFVDHFEEILGATDQNIDWNNPAQKISKYFTVREVTKGDARRIPPAGGEIEKAILELARNHLDRIREEWGSPVLVTSWYRPPAINRAIGGASNSHHIFGRAVDVKPVNKSDLIRFQTWLDEHWYGGLGYGARRGFVHLDTRNNKGWKSGGAKGVRWNY